MSLPELRLEFEDILRRRYPKQPQDFARDSHGMYKNKRINNMWEFMRIQHQLTHYDEAIKEHKPGVGNYVIGQRVDNGYIFSRKPCIHRHRLFAFNEVQRLTNKYNMEFALFRCIHVTTLPPTDIELPAPVLETVQNWLP